MNPPDATFTNGRYELPAHPRGVLVLADPPEAGWQIEPPSNGQSDSRKARDVAATSREEK